MARDDGIGAGADRPPASVLTRAARERFLKARGDRFGDEQKRLFLVALRNRETVLAACRLVGVSNRTAYNHRQSDPEFARYWDLARKMARLPLELVAFERAVVGIAEPVFVQGRHSHNRRRYSDGLLRLLLEGEQPDKYGRGARARAQSAKLEEHIAARVVEQLATLLARAVNVVNPVPGEKIELSQRDNPPRRGLPAPETADFADNREAAGEARLNRPGPDPSAAPRSSFSISEASEG